MLTFSVKGQVTEAGFHFGYNTSKLKLDKRKLSDQVFIKPGKVSSGLTFGVQVYLAPPPKQSKPGLSIIPGVLFESSLCRCANKVELSLTNENGTRSFNELKYVIYRGDFSGKFVGTIKKFQFLIGPTISTKFYAGVRVNGSGLKYAGNQFKNVAAGYELGVGKKINSVMLSIRYHGLFETYGRKSELIPEAYKNYQFRFMLHYFFLRKEKGRYWDSIYWK